MHPQITDIAGLQIGHWSDEVGRTGCSVLLTPGGAIAAGDVRGGGPGTRETDLLQPGRLVEQVHALVLTGGSAFGLAAADGVVQWLAERGYGFDTGVARVPIVPAAVLFDLAVGDPAARPNAASGYAACEAAGRVVVEGAVGAGTGATVGKLLGIASSSAGGVGSVTLRLPDGTLVGAVVVVNAFGHVVDPATGAILAGARRPDGTFVDTVAALLSGQWGAMPGASTNTTLGVVVTDARLDRAACQRVATVAHNGLARTIRPVHTQFDGDALFVMSLPGRDGPPADITLLGVGAAEAVAGAVLRAVSTAARAVKSDVM